MFDVSIFQQLKDGDRDAFDSLFRYYYPRLMAYVTTIVEEDVAEDIVQDVFLYVWENHERLYAGEGFHAYLFQAAYTRSLDHLRKKTSAEKHQSQVYNSYLDECSDSLKADGSILEELSTKDFYKRLYQLLDNLPAQRREVFILTYIKGMKAKEVAEAIQMPQRTVESHIYLSVKYLKKHMSTKDFYLLCMLVVVFFLVYPFVISPQQSDASPEIRSVEIMDDFVTY